MTPRERLLDAISGERYDWHEVSVRPRDIAEVLADYDHLVEVARAFVTAHDHGGLGYSPIVWCDGQCSPLAALRALIDPATPEPVEGEPDE